jgi:hypothetical protein
MEGLIRAANFSKSFASLLASCRSVKLDELDSFFSIPTSDRELKKNKRSVPIKKGK